MNQQQVASRTKMRFLSSFWFKMFVIMAGVVLLSTAITWGLLTLHQNAAKKSFQKIMETEFQKKSLLIAQFVSAYGIPAYYEKRETEKLRSIISTVRARDPKNILYIFIRDPDGKILVQTPENVVTNETSLGRLDTINRILPGNGVSHKTFAAAINTENPEGMNTIIDTALHVIEGQQAELHVGTAVQLNPPTPFSLASMLIPFAVVLLLGIGAIVIWSYTSSQIRQPVVKLGEYITQIGQGNMNYVLDVQMNNELATLKDYLNGMVEQLKGTVRTEADINQMQGQIMNMLSTVSAAADGNLTVEAEVTADALGSLADAFNMMVASLASLVEQVRKSATNMSTATNEILLSSAQMIKGAEEQQNHINNITSAVDEIAVSMQQVANNAEAAARASQMATEAAQKGAKSVEETILGMHRIRNTVQATSKKIKNLGDRSIEIGEITTTIEDIARQTTILALNAAIEAARAGEHGRGFGVVAEEVRKLAERSSIATRDIGDRIKGIQAETNEAVRTMEDGTREVEEGTRLADIAGKSLKEIDKSVGQVADLIQEISLAAKQQARGTDGVVKSMETISDIANLHADGVRKTTETIERLATLSDRLVEAIGNFKIRESDDAKPEAPERKALIPPQPKPKPNAPPPTPSIAPFVPPVEAVPSFTPPTGEDEDELIETEDFFKTS